MSTHLTSFSVFRAIGGFLIAGLMSASVQAVPVYVESITYAYSGGVYNPVSDSYSGPGPGSVDAYATNYSPYARGSSAASAASGSLAVVSTASLMGPDYSGTLEAVSESTARMTIDDIVFNGPGSSVTTSLNLDWSGSMMETLLPQNFDTYGTTNNTLSISGRLFGNNTTYLEFRGERIVSVEQDSPIAIPTESVSTTGILAGQWPPNGFNDLVTDTFSVPTGTDISLELTLYTRSTAGYYLTGSSHIEGTAYSAADFGHTLSLNSDGSVFNLATGENVNSVNGNIASNSWNGTPVSASVVPVPASVYLFGSGLALLGFGCSRKDRY